MKRRLGIFIALCCVIMFTFTACADKEGNTNNSGNNTGTDNTLMMKQMIQQMILTIQQTLLITEQMTLLTDNDTLEQWYR